MSLIFSNDAIDIPDETKIVLWRFNNGNHSPFNIFSGHVNWDLSAKSVCDDSGVGIYGVWDENINLTGNIILHEAYGDYKEQVFIEMEADRRDILSIKSDEVSVSKCNIIRKLTSDEFANRFPIYQDALFWNKAAFYAEEPYDFNSYKNKAYTRFYERHTHKEALSIYSQDTKVHGYAHSLRVERNIKLLERHFKLSGFLRDFAYYHDILRINDGADPDHGKRAADLLRRVRQHPNFSGMSENIFEKLCFACENHTTMLRSGDPLIDICFDADRLDLMRVGIKPDPKAMATYIGAHYAENYESYVADFQNESL